MSSAFLRERLALKANDSATAVFDAPDANFH